MRITKYGKVEITKNDISYKGFDFDLIIKVLSWVEEKIKEEQKIKVYCSNCIELRRSYNKEGYNCDYKDNATITLKEDWLNIEEVKTYLKECKELNKNNDCKWYKKR